MTESQERVKFDMNVIEVGYGTEMIEHMDQIMMHVKGKMMDDTVFLSTFESEPVFFVVGSNGQLDCIEFGIKGLVEGDHVEFICPPELAFGSEGTSKVPPDTPVKIEVLVTKVTKIDKATKKKELNNQSARDIVVEEGGIHVKVTNYDGEGPKIKKGDKVTFHYSSILEDGRKIETSRGGDPIEMIYGFGDVFRCWKESFKSL